MTLPRDFYARPVEEVAADVIGCLLRHGETAGRIVEAEAYHEREPACHGYGGLTERTRVLFGEPGRAYVYRSYGIHACLNAVSESDGVGAAVLIRALEPVDGLALMRSRRGVERAEGLCSGPGKLTQALGIWLDLNGTSLESGPIEISPPPADAPPVQLEAGSRIGITRAAELPWRFCDVGSGHLSRPWPRRVARASIKTRGAA
jgi:DNA-3-methyladenine glycosylase